MIDEPVSIIAFVLIAFAAFAVPTTIAFVLFGLLRREPSASESTISPNRHTRVVNSASSLRRRFGLRRNRFGSDS